MFPNTSLLTDAREKLLKLEDTADILRKGAKYIYIFFWKLKQGLWDLDIWTIFH